MSDNTLTDLEAALLKDPFNTTMRMQYAAALLEDEQADAAVDQYKLVVGQQPENASALVGLGRGHLAQDNREAAVDCYTRAKGKPDFAADSELQALLDLAKPRDLQLVQGGGNVMVLNPGDPTATKFSDVAGMDELKKTLRLQIIEPFRNPGLFKRFRKKAGGGVLLYGPPGCGKTLMARAIAGECNLDFVAVGISDILSMWTGESENNLSLIFEQARERKPCVLFFDELDALAYSRSKSSSNSARTVVNEFLSQLDGFDTSNEGLLILAATNMPWDVDPAMKRPGRFARQVFVPPPDTDAREAMLHMKMAEVPADSIDYTQLAKSLDFYSGADIDGLIDQAKENVLGDILETGEERPVRQSDFVDALESQTPSTVDWLTTARNLVKFSGADNSYKAVEKYLRKVKKL